jgi:hypothetical protein
MEFDENSAFTVGVSLLLDGLDPDVRMHESWCLEMQFWELLLQNAPASLLVSVELKFVVQAKISWESERQDVVVG